MSKSKSKIVEEIFTNNFGQSIVPGDKVAYIASGYCHRINMGQGTYVGMVYTKSWRNENEWLCSAVKLKDIPAKRWIYDHETKKGYYEEYTRSTYLPLKRIFKLA